MQSGYDFFQTEPNTVKEIKCKVCGAICNVKRNEYGPTSWITAMANKKQHHDEFTCPNAEKEWHEDALDLLEEIEETKSKRVNKLLKQDLQELLETHSEK